MIFGNVSENFPRCKIKQLPFCQQKLWVEIKRLTDHLSNILISYDKSNKIDPSILTTLVAMEAKIALISRTIIGVDELTGESLSLFSSKKHYDDLTNIEIEQFEKYLRS